MKRRDFFKITAIASGAVLSTCNNKLDEKILPYLVPPDDGVTPGVPRYVNSTCTLCPERCGLTIKILDEKPVKAEGNPDHPENKGSLCIRGQSSIASLYHPERLKFPLMKNSNGKFERSSWETVLTIIRENIDLFNSKGFPNIFFSKNEKGSLNTLIKQFCSKKNFVFFPEKERISYNNLSKANSTVFGVDTIPYFNVKKSDFILSIGADMVETFLNPMRFSKEIQIAKEKNGMEWYHIGEFPTLTGYSADKNLTIKSDGEKYLLQYLIHNTGREKKLPDSINSFPGPDDIGSVSRKTGIKKSVLKEIVEKINSSSSPLVIIGGTSISTDKGLENSILTAILQFKNNMMGKTVELYSDSPTFKKKSDTHIIENELDGEDLGMLIVSNSSFYKFPENRISKFKNSKLKVLLTEINTEESSEFDIILPLADNLESWGDNINIKGLFSIIQPAIKPAGESLPMGDILLRLLSSNHTWQSYLSQEWRKNNINIEDLILKGFHKTKNIPPKIKLNPDFPSVLNSLAGSESSKEKEFTLYFKPDIRKYDGTLNHIDLLSEIPDPLTTVSYGDYIEISKEQSEKLGAEEGDILSISGKFGEIELPSIISPQLYEGKMIIPLSSAVSLNLFDSEDSRSAKLVYSDIKIKKTGKNAPVPRLSGSFSTDGREIFPTLAEGKNNHSDHHELFTLYPNHEHKNYRWAMVIDLDKCNGCSSCVASCYIENNVPMTGEKEHLKGREMSWLRIEPYFNSNGECEFLPMMCQQCDDAPCETVCPVYATYHNDEGLNAQIYNRCVGTRYCANNCPYKSRRFNWFDNSKSLPLYGTHNPELSVRPKGVMEKCTFCIQRIRYAKDKAKDEKRNVNDGEIQPACAQSCPSEAIVFGNLLDPDSKVSQLIRDRTVFRVHESLGTRPAVYYLKTEESKVIKHFEKKLEEG